MTNDEQRPRVPVVFNFKSKYWVLTSVIISLLFSGCSRGDGDAGRTAPDFSLPDLSGNMVSLEEHRGNIVLLDFWATWCPPCRNAIPELVGLQKRYKDQGVVILGISLDDPHQFKNKYLLAFKEKFKMNYKVLRADSEVVQDYFSTPNMALPTLFVINREGKIVEKHVGYVPGAVEKSLRKIL